MTTKVSEKWVYVALCILSFIYLLLRCIYIPLVHDEAVTFFNYINTGKFIPFLDWASHEDANNHILNSALSYLSFKTFGDHYWALRLPSLLFSILCFIYVWRIASWIEIKWQRWLLIMSILGAHYFMEFYSVTRGYGMSMALLLAAIFHLFRFLKDIQTKDLLWYAIFTTFALLANLTLVNTALIGLILVFYTLVTKRSSLQKINVSLITIFGLIIPLLAAIYSGYKYKEMGLLYYGQGYSYWDVTVKSFFRRFTLVKNLDLWVYPVIMSVIALSFIIFIKRLIELKWQAIHSIHMLFAGFFFGNLIASLIQTTFLGVNYPEDRTGLFFFPFLVGTIIFQINYKPWLKHLSWPLLFLPLQFLWIMNLSYNSFWKLERLPERMYLTVQEELEKHNYQPMVGGYQIRQVVWDYYNHKHGGWLGRIQDQQFPMDTVSDYIIARADQNPYWQTLYSSIDKDPYSELELFKRNTFLIPTAVELPEHITWLDSTTKEFVNFHHFFGPFEYGKHYVVDFELDYRPLEPSTNCLLVMQGIDKFGKNVFMHNFSLERFRTLYHYDIHCHQKLISPELPEDVVELRVYLHNKNEEPIHIWNAKVGLYVYQ